MGPGIPKTANPITPGPMVPSADAAKRIALTVRRVEDSWRNRPPSQGSGPQAWTRAACWMKTTSTISARSGATYGSGSAKLQSDSGTAFVDDGITVTLYNGTDKTIASGAYILAIFTLGKWWAGVPGSCSNLS